MPELSYTIKHSLRAKRLSLKVERTGKVVVVLPKRFPVKLVDSFINENADWIRQKLANLEKAERIVPESLGLNSHAKYLLKAKKQITQKVKDWNEFYKFDYKKITIKNTSTRWGSCSRAGNLNFNYKLIFTEEKLLDYVVIHELCHLQEMNHGPRFWNLVSEAMPDYKIQRHKLKNIIIQ